MGNATYFNDAYCDQLLNVLLNEHGAKLHKGATLFAYTAPCLILQAIAPIMTARNRFEKTQNAADGNFPDGTLSVGSKTVVIISSCMYPHVKYDACKPAKQKKSFVAC